MSVESQQRSWGESSNISLQILISSFSSLFQNFFAETLCSSRSKTLLKKKNRSEIIYTQNLPLVFYETSGPWPGRTLGSPGKLCSRVMPRPCSSDILSELLWGGARQLRLPPGLSRDCLPGLNMAVAWGVFHNDGAGPSPGPTGIYSSSSDDCRGI